MESGVFRPVAARAGAGLILAPRSVMPSRRRPLRRRQPEVLIGRSLALCVHPYAAWRSQSSTTRMFVFTAYLTASYLVVLGMMFLAR
jgi:hypothetical protein